MALLEINGVCRLTRNPEVRHLPGSDTAVAQFGVACSEKYKDKEKSAFYDCKAWGRLAEICGEYLTKGSQIFIRGKLEQEQWEDKDSGQKRSKHVINIQSMEMLGGKKDNGEKYGSGASAGEYNGGGMDESDIPFMAYEKFLL